MFYLKDYLKDCTVQPLPPQRDIEQIAKWADEAFSWFPYVESAELVISEDIDGDGPIELLVNIDPQFGMPLPRPPFFDSSKSLFDRCCDQLGDELVARLGRDVDCYTGDDARAHKVGRNRKVIYERDAFYSEQVEELKRLYIVIKSDVQDAARCLDDDFRVMASNICYHSAAVVLTSLKIATGAMGGWILDVDEPSIDEGATALKLNNSRTLKMSISGALSEAAAEEVRAIDDSGLRHAASELDYYMRCALDDAPLNGLDALCALFYANEFADFLHRAGRPAFWIPIRNPEVIELMRVLDIAPKGTKIGKGDRVWFNYKRKKNEPCNRHYVSEEGFGFVESVDVLIGGGPDEERSWIYTVREGASLHEGLKAGDMSRMNCFR